MDLLPQEREQQPPPTSSPSHQHPHRTLGRQRHRQQEWRSGRLRRRIRQRSGAVALSRMVQPPRGSDGCRSSRACSCSRPSCWTVRMSILLQLLAIASRNAAAFRAATPPILRSARCVRRFRFNDEKTSSLASLSSSSSASRNNSRMMDELLESVINNELEHVDEVDGDENGSVSLENKKGRILDDEGTFQKRSNEGEGGGRVEWKSIDWKAVSDRIFRQRRLRQQQQPPPSPVDVLMVRGRVVYVKRDDLLKLPGSGVSGNKARKMLALERCLEDGGGGGDDDEGQEGNDDDFPEIIASYGGPQSNAMLALAAAVHFRNTKKRGDGGGSSRRRRRHRFVYYTKKLPRFLMKQPSGNLFRATSLGMELVELSPAEYARLFGGDWGGRAEPPAALPPPPAPALAARGSGGSEGGGSARPPSRAATTATWIPQGGASSMAYAGCRVLAEEIIDFWKRHGGGRPLSVCLPGGTCSTAALLHLAFRDINSMQQQQQQQQKQQSGAGGVNSEQPLVNIQVVVVPCVGDEGYARRQMMSLCTQMGYPADEVPYILPPSPADSSYFGQTTAKSGNGGDSIGAGYFSFGEPHLDILSTFREMKDEHGLVLDLLYGASAWTVLLRHWRGAVGRNRKDRGVVPSPLHEREIMYVHTGGLEGINSQMLRYKYKNLVDFEDIQLPGRSRRKSSSSNSSSSDDMDGAE